MVTRYGGEKFVTADELQQIAADGCIAPIDSLAQGVGSRDLTTR